MAQTTLLLNALKKALRADGKTYADVASALDLSTASVKRLFAQQAFSLQRLDKICELLGIELSDLLQEVRSASAPLQQLSEEVEAAIAGDMLLLLVTVAVLNRLSIDDIVARFNINEPECVRKLAWLDRTGIIDLFPRNRFRVRVASNFAWRPDGPIQRFFLERLSAEYFSTRFRGCDETLLVLNGVLTSDALAQFQQRMHRLAREFNELNGESSGAPLAARSGYTAVLAVRPWVFGAFAGYMRE
jgi:DNA-binding Xre family transcriptional regulator